MLDLIDIVAAVADRLDVSRREAALAVAAVFDEDPQPLLAAEDGAASPRALAWLALASGAVAVAVIIGHAVRLLLDPIAAGIG